MFGLIGVWVTTVCVMFVAGVRTARAQDDSKSINPAGAYEVNATKITSARPPAKPTVKPARPRTPQQAQPNAQAGANSGKNATNRTDPRTPPPRPSVPAAQTEAKTREQNVYLVTQGFPQGPPPGGQEYARIGVTIWRLGPNQCQISDCPLPAGNDKGLVDTATRTEDSTLFNPGERVRLGLESLTHSGYLYVIDREQFTDGTLGEAYLIFPTKKIDDGKNWAQPGLQVHLPRASGCFCVKSRDPNRILAADVLTVIVSPVPLLRENEIGADAVPLPGQLNGFVSRAGQERTYRGTLQGGVGLAQTVPEKAAGEKGLIDTEPTLTQGDLGPQNIYQSAISKGASAVFTFSLRYSLAPEKARHKP
jgi:hypothetical protein